MSILLAILIPLVATPSHQVQDSRVVRVADDEGLRRALDEAGPGTTIALEPGEYRGGSR